MIEQEHEKEEMLYKKHSELKSNKIDEKKKEPEVTTWSEADNENDKEPEEVKP